MPIRTEMKALYPANWKQIRAAILARAENKCEKCGRPNGVAVLVAPDGTWNRYIWELPIDMAWRDENGNRVTSRPRRLYHSKPNQPEMRDGTEDFGGCHLTKTILTISHTDHDPTNNDPSNLRALCQRCHLSHDAKEHASNARRTRARKAGQCELKGL